MYQTMETAETIRGKQLPFDYLEEITEEFSEEVITGVDTTVHKAILQDGVIIVVERHVAEEPHKFDKDAYTKKVVSIMQHKHDNVVELLAFCIEEREETMRLIDGEIITCPGVERLFIYEYIPYTLDHIIFVEKKDVRWTERFEIIKGICNGLQFLHTLNPPIIHLNLQPGNIMLDHDMNPKIGDFGYSRIVDPEHSQVLTESSVGSIGYMAPEYFKGIPKEGKEREISKRFDIYSLGLIIIEITTGRKNSSLTKENSSGADQSCAREFIDKVKENCKDASCMIREYDGINDDDDYSHKIRCIDLALTCVDLDQKRRPKIADIVNNFNLGKWY